MRVRGDSLSQIETLENVIIGYVGPFAKYVVKNQMTSLNISPDECTNEELWTLVLKVIDSAIFDPVLRQEAKQKLRKQLNLSASQEWAI